MKTNQLIANECLTLACFCDYTYDGENVISGAFDCPHGYFHRTDASEAYNFSIFLKDGALTLTVDAYTVANEFTEFTSETWDVDAWENHMIELTMSANRVNFYALSQAARALINGRSVTFSDGTVILFAIARVTQ